MSLLIGQHGSLLRENYAAGQQYTVVAPNQQDGFSKSAGSSLISLGAFLQPGPYASLSPEDPSRFRPTSYVAPTEIELMHGFLDMPFQNGNPLQADPVVMPHSTFIDQTPPSLPSLSCGLTLRQGKEMQMQRQQQQLGYTYIPSPARGQGQGDYIMSNPYGIMVPRNKCSR